MRLATALQTCPAEANLTDGLECSGLSQSFVQPQALLVVTSPTPRASSAGLGEHFGEALTIAETTCMHRGADRCALVVTAA
jgi:hypothetical protein